MDWQISKVLRFLVLYGFRGGTLIAGKKVLEICNSSNQSIVTHHRHNLILLGYLQ